MDKDNKLCDKCGLRPQQKAQPKPCACKPKKCCKKKDCCNDNEFAFRKVVIPASLGDDVTGQDLPSNGAYTNSYVVYEANGAQYMYDSFGVYTKLGGEGGGGTGDFNDLSNRPKYAGSVMTGNTDIPSVSAETLAREQADNGLQSQIDAITVSSDVRDVVGTYAELEAYDTSTLGDNDIIKVLEDEEHNDATTYYRWNAATQTFTLIGEEGPYYTKSAADSRFQAALTAGAHISIGSNNEISATYTHFTGTDGQTDGVAGLVPAPATTDAGKFLKADGTWDTAGGSSVNVVQTTGTSQTDVMSQKAVTNIIFPDGNESDHKNVLVGSLSSTPASFGDYNIRIGSNINSLSGSQEQVIIGHSAGNGQSANECVILGHSAYGQSECIAIGHSATAQGGGNTIAIGHSAQAFTTDTIAIGSKIRVANSGSVVIGNGYGNNTQYTTRSNEFCVHASATANQPMVHSNVDTPTLDTDAANKNYVDSFYPVGAVYTSTSATAPTFAGGTWTEIGTQTIGSSTVHYYERTA